MLKDFNNPKSFYLSEDENQKVFTNNIIPKYIKEYDFKSSNNPIVFLTGGLPGAGKSALVNIFRKKLNNDKTFVANSDEMRPFHPKYEEAMEKFGSEAGAAVHHDATIFSEKLINYAIEKKTNFIIDGTLKDPKKANTLINTLHNNGYNINITMIAVNKYESLHGIFNRYAEQYLNNPATARFVNPKFIEIGKQQILKSVEVISSKNINRFTIIDRDRNILYDSNIHKDKSPVAIMKDSTNLKNWNQDKRDKLLNNFEKVIQKLKDYKAPQNIIDMAKDIQKDLILEIKNIKSKKSSLFPLRGSKKGLER